MPDPTGVRQASVQRSREALLAAATAAFLDQGVQAPVRDIAARAGVGVGTVYRHFPTRAHLVSAVYRHQVEECTALAAELRRQPVPAAEALNRWIAAFVDFLVTKHGLSVALRSQDPGLANLHALVLDDLVPACSSLLVASQETGEIDRQIAAFTLLRAVGNLCIPGPGYGRDDAKQMVARLLVGCASGLSPPPEVSSTTSGAGPHRERVDPERRAPAEPDPQVPAVRLPRRAAMLEQEPGR